MSFEKDTITHDEEDSTVDSHDEKFESPQKVFDRIQEEIQVSNLEWVPSGFDPKMRLASAICSSTPPTYHQKKS